MLLNKHIFDITSLLFHFISETVLHSKEGKNGLSSKNRKSVYFHITLYVTL